MNTVPNWLDGRNALIVGNGVGMDAVAEALRQAGATLVHADFCDDLEAATEAVEAAAAQAGGALDILVHAGNPNTNLLTENMDIAEWRNAMMENMDSKFYFSSAFARTIIGSDQKGAILYLDRPEKGADAAMVTAGGAMSSLTKTLSVEWARDAIRVNAIVSDAVYSGNKGQLTSLGNMAAYLCSDFAGYVTGASLGIDDEI